ncbi:hydroxysqualene dehydroxylase HpnE [Allokutzneria oryzae]|uniref:Hydroxysqualene dehydroxylase HpnE n=1 Tax=Allokutzneria oryzae TaxID=1378989 RepID=A0ABV5ZYH5_9PSEU
MSGRVTVIGGGLAGIAAALRCAAAGCSVRLFEARPWLGGLTYSFRRGDLWVDNGQHVFLRCCTAYRALLDRLGMADSVVLQDRLAIPVRAPGLRGESWLRRGIAPAPLHLAGSLLRYRSLPLPDRVRFARAALALRRVDPGDPGADRESFAAWLARHGQSPRAITALWELIAVPALNVHAEYASLAQAAAMFQQGLLSDPTAADIGWPQVPLGRLHGDAARTRLAEAGARVRLGSRVRAIEPLGRGWRIVTDRDTGTADQVVLAVPPSAAERLLPPGAVARPPGWSAALGSSPIVNVHVVLDRPVLPHPFVAGVGSPVQWVFDRTRQSGLANGQYLALSLSAADEEIDRPVAALRMALLPELGRLLPGLPQAHVADFFVTRERHATFRPAPGTAALRPGPVTGAAGLYLAGAWTATGWPDTMEGAVRSGDTAAHALLEHRHRAAEEVVA